MAAPLQLSASADYAKLGILQAAGPAQRGISHVYIAPPAFDQPCSAYFATWSDAALAFLPLSARVGGTWGEIYPGWILHGPGCVDGATPLFPWMAQNGVSIAFMQHWAGDNSATAASLDEPARESEFSSYLARELSDIREHFLEISGEARAKRTHR